MKPTEENIEQAIKNLRQPADAQTKQRILDRLLQTMNETHQQTSAPPRPNIWRIIMKSRITKLAAAAVIVIGVVVGFSQLGGTITFADVVKPILNAKTIIVDIAFGPDETGPVMHDIVVGSRIRRTMSHIPNTTLIIDIEGGKILTLDTKAKTAVYADIAGLMQEATRGFLDMLRQIINKLQSDPRFTVANLGEKEINGHKAVGFAGGGPGADLTIWADPKTALPLRIELKMGTVFVVMENFEFNVPVDDSLVSMDLPPGYQLQEAEVDLSDATEQEFIDALRVWAEVILQGQFPEDISIAYYMKHLPALVDKLSNMNLPGEEIDLNSAILMKGMLFIQLYEAKQLEKWHYAGRGVKFGDADKAVFWYRPKDSQTYRVIYGDLRVADVAPENLPR